MNKKILSLVVGAVLIAGAMLDAQAQVTVYGKFHVSWDRQDNDAAPVSVERSLVSSNTSRFGLKGEQNIESIPKAKVIYQMESGAFGTDEGGGTMAGRNTFVGVSHNLGTVKVGRHDTPYKELGYRTNRFIEQAGDARNVMGDGNAAANDSRLGFDSRPDNMIRYDSPSFGGIQAAALYSGNNSTTATGDETGAAGQTWSSVRVTWQRGPLFVGGAVEQHGKTPGVSKKERGIRAVGEYALRAFTVGVFAEALNDLGGAGGADAEVLGVAGAFRFGNNTAKAHVFTRTKTDTAVTDNGSTMIALGLDHALNKTTTVYANLSAVDNDPAASRNTVSTYTGHGDVVATAAGRKPKALSVGIMVNF